MCASSRATNFVRMPSFAAAIFFASLFAAVLALPIFRLKGDYFAFATLAIVPLAAEALTTTT